MGDNNDGAPMVDDEVPAWAAKAEQTKSKAKAKGAAAKDTASDISSKQAKKAKGYAVAAGLVKGHPTGWAFLKTDMTRGWALMLIILAWFTAIPAMAFHKSCMGDDDDATEGYDNINAGGAYLAVLGFGILFQLLFLLAYTLYGLDKLRLVGRCGPVIWEAVEFWVQVLLLLATVIMAIVFGFGISDVTNSSDCDSDFSGYIYALVCTLPATMIFQAAPIYVSYKDLRELGYLEWCPWNSGCKGSRSGAAAV